MSALIVVLLAAAAAPPFKLDAAAQKNLRDQAQRMSDAGVAKNWGVLVDAMYPPVVKMMGGREKTIASTKESAEESDAAGLKMTSSELGELKKCVRVADGTLQCVISQTIRMVHDGQRSRVVSDLVAFSSDKGAHWTFLTASSNDLATLRKHLPEISPELPIVPQGPPVVDGEAERAAQPAALPAKR